MTQAASLDGAGDVVVLVLMTLSILDVRHTISQEASVGAWEANTSIWDLLIYLTSCG